MAARCLIVDDEPLSIMLIEKFVNRFTELEVAGKCEDGLSALEFLKKNTVELIFLDIQMPELTGIELLKILKNRPKVIITTAYRDYAIEGYELEVFDYLLKPLSFERFVKAINRFLNEYSKPAEPTEEKTGDEEEIINPQDNTILVRENYKNVKIRTNQIEYVESFREYVHIHTTEREIRTKMKISILEDDLPEPDFVRIHKSYLIRLAAVQAYNANQVTIKNRELPIGRTYKKMVLTILQESFDAAE